MGDSPEITIRKPLGAHLVWLMAGAGSYEPLLSSFSFQYVWERPVKHDGKSRGVDDHSYVFSVFSTSFAENLVVEFIGEN